MDSDRSATAPSWDNEKSSMVQNPPPPYYDNPGVAPPGQAYPPQVRKKNIYIFIKLYDFV